MKDDLQSFRVEQQLCNKYVEEKIEDLQENDVAVNKELGNVKESLVLFIKFCSLVNHLQIQD